jgi:hypothetical protein
MTTYITKLIVGQSRSLLYNTEPNLYVPDCRIGSFFQLTIDWIKKKHFCEMHFIKDLDKLYSSSITLLIKHLETGHRVKYLLRPVLHAFLTSSSGAGQNRDLFSVSKAGRVTRWVCEKVAQNIAQPLFCLNYCKTVTVEKVAPNCGLILYFSIKFLVKNHW